MEHDGDVKEECPPRRVVIGHRVPEDSRNQIVSEARSRSARATIVFLYRGRIRDAAVLSVDSGPALLANSLLYLLLEQGRAR